MVFQRPVLLRRTALANVEYALSLRGVSRQVAIAVAKEAGRLGVAHAELDDDDAVAAAVDATMWHPRYLPFRRPGG